MVYAKLNKGKKSMVYLWNNIDSHGPPSRRLDFWEGGNDQGPH